MKAWVHEIEVQTKGLPYNHFELLPSSKATAMFTAVMSLALVAVVVAAAVQFSLTMDEMLSHSTARPVQGSADAATALAPAAAR